jgi:hypothetical protein
MQHALDVKICYLNYCRKHEDLGVNGSIILKKGGTLWKEFIWLRRGFYGGQLQQGSEPSFTVRHVYRLH